jgi:hypothetical protein
MLSTLVRWLVVCAVALGAVSCAAAEVAEPTWHHVPEYSELYFTAAAEPNLRMHVNAPADDAGRPVRGTRLIVFALPNGNTIEQTLGCRVVRGSPDPALHGAVGRPATTGLDWHYDIQHVAAQVRLLRSLSPDERIVLVLAEAGGLSWPRWRGEVPDANAQIGRLIDGWRQRFGTDDAKLTLTGHSGGGSFMFGTIEAADMIPAAIDRIAFLDANYSFDAALHADKLSRWLTGDESRRLIVAAYDDREIVLDGKKVVGPTGGTFRATGRMREAFGPRFTLVEAEQPPFHEMTALDGRIHFYVHPNPQNKILHTALVGEMNGLVHALTLGTPLEGTWGTFGGPRAYTKWVQPEPTPSDDPPAAKPTTPADSSQLPPRPAEAIGGTEFLRRIVGLNLSEREAAILQEIVSGNFPEFLRRFKAVSIRGTGPDGKELAASLAVMPDYLAVGSDADFVRLPMTPQTAQQIADRFGCVLPTRKIVDAIDTQAEVRLAPHPLAEAREAVATFLEHHQIIERQRAGHAPGLLVAGIKKDIVLSPRIFERAERLALYGWRQPGGRPIQPLSIVHWNRYVDYSHGARLVRNAVEVDGAATTITALLADPALCAVVSDEGPMNPPRYPTN